MNSHAYNKKKCFPPKQTGKKFIFKKSYLLLGLLNNRKKGWVCCISNSLEN